MSEYEYTPLTYKNGKFRPHYKSKAYRVWYYYLNHEKTKEYANKRYHEKLKQKNKLYREENKDRENARCAKWRQKHPDYMSNYMKSRRISNPGLVKSEERLKDINRKQRFIYKHLLDDIELFYSKCKENEVVDHIIPLQGKNVSGLHVPWNLQILNTDENNFKRNKFDGTYNNESWKIKFKERNK